MPRETMATTTRVTARGTTATSPSEAQSIFILQVLSGRRSGGQAFALTSSVNTSTSPESLTLALVTGLRREMTQMPAEQATRAMATMIVPSTLFSAMNAATPPTTAAAGNVSSQP